MTVHHFIASLKELPAVSLIDETYGISVFEADGYESMLKHKFRNPYVYELLCSHTREGYSVLFTFIDHNLYTNELIELYTCLDGHEEKPKDDSLDMVIDLKTFHFRDQYGNFKLAEKSYIDELSKRFWFREKQYVVVTK